ncbi:3-phosphoshikimate 1-carboxyvinyltransferase [Clostridium sp.]|uniref:3-phosphoshikimate 1-carboxyvinyltransferase n=1 Tax=Clostridium sp. TaxID=1506 RepID=UPI00261E220C|nr:3-phosphoshikimate 1-carboxyvinyltransferase [Clostridium sp.]
MAVLKLKNNKLKGNIKVPPSKSLSHRAIICAALGGGKSIIENVDFSEDIIATIEAMETLGAKIIKKENNIINVWGMFNEESKRKLVRDIDCNESGSTLRFVIPISLLFNGITKFIGKGNLGSRPLDTYFEIFEEQGIKYNNIEDGLNMIVKGNIKPGEFNIKGNISSQFVSGLLFTLPLLDGDSKINITTKMESKSYIDLTIDCMKDFGVYIENKDYKEFIIKGNQKYESRNYKLEGDYSQAAFYLVANVLGSEVGIEDLNLESLQGDKAIIGILERMGAEFYKEENIIKTRPIKELKGTIIDASNCPDIIPILALAAALANGKTEIINAGRLRIKECDRLKAVYSELEKLGAKIEEKENGLLIEGVSELKGGVDCWSFKDHRIAMTIAIASTRCIKEISLIDYDVVSKSYPNFFEDFKRLGGGINGINMGE